MMENEQTQTIDYLDGFQYKDGKLDFIPTAEGYVKAVHTGNTTEYHYIYHYTDHLGNIRLSYGRDPETNEVAILKESHYYPYGLQHQGYVDTHQIFPGIIGVGKVELFPVRNYLDDSYRYTFGGKEEQLELGLNWLDFHARNYMPDLGRWMSPDPLAEEYSSWSPYNYVMNSPLRNIDPTGAFSITLTGQDAQNYMERLINDIKNNEDNNKDVLTANLNDFLANGGGGSNNNDSMNRPIPIGDYSRGVSRRTATGVSPQNNELYSDLGAVSWFGGTVAEGISRNSTYHAKNFIAKYGNRFSSASEITAKTRTSMANTARIAEGIGHGFGILDVTLTILKFNSISDPRWGDYGELGVSLSAVALTSYGPTAPVGLVASWVDLAGGFDGFYNHLNQQEQLYNSTGGVMLPTNSIPTFIKLKKQ